MSNPTTIVVQQNADGTYDIPAITLVPYVPPTPVSPPPPPPPPPPVSPPSPPAPPPSADYAGALAEGQAFDPPAGA